VLRWPKELAPLGLGSQPPRRRVVGVALRFAQVRQALEHVRPILERGHR
jgi:hypothetical protein